LSEEEKRARNKRIQEDFATLRQWWFRQMLNAQSPLAERMTLFWHNHFVSSAQKVRSPALMYRQHSLYRREALGNFARLLHAAAKEPAMVLYLDAASSKKGAPNENFAREVMELFTLGEGRYSERDVKEAARAFTGWGFERDSGNFVVRPRLQDRDVKTVFGKSGAFEGDAVLDILLEQRATAEFITAKLWREFISPTPEPKAVAQIARRFYDSGFELRVVLRELFLSEAFWDHAQRGSLVKSPVELVVGSLRTLGVGEAAFAVRAAAQMGQVLFAPPNVKGWPGGAAWIDSSTLLKRREFLARLAQMRGGLVITRWQQALAAHGLDASMLLLGEDGGEGVSVEALLADARFQVK
jgi:uncharacterized protein (DUF1800 family)